ncbi:MAG: methylenetetrahydrofolate reductase [NAD(P)H] [Coraliomargaritaceae bacterium]|jgi:methylenetetrahydrofolate reductase (NADPH)
MESQTIIHTIASGKKTLSLEFFPPKSDKAIQQLKESSRDLAKLSPDFVSITYGAGGSTRKSTFTYAEQLKTDHDYKVMPHLTCVGHSQNELAEIIQQYQEAGFRTLMALRGDPQGDSQTFTPHPDGFQYANQLVAFIKSQFPNFEIGVGGYPEKHPESPSQTNDIQNLKKKVDAGADFITTQLFYNNDHYYRFVDQCRDAQIDCPIIPGLMIPTNLERVERFCHFCQAELPDSLKAALSSAHEDSQALQDVAVEWTFQQVKALLENGAPGIHLYIMNQSKFVLALYQKLREADHLFHR